MVLLTYFLVNFSDGSTVTEKDKDWIALQIEKDLKQATAVQLRHSEKNVLATLQIPENHLGLFYFKNAIAPRIVHCDVCRWKEEDASGNQIKTQRCGACRIFYRADTGVLRFALNQFEDEKKCKECSRKLVNNKCQYDGYTLVVKLLNEKVDEMRQKVAVLEQEKPDSNELTVLKNIKDKYDADPEYPEKLKGELKTYEEMPNSFLPVQNYEVRKTIGYVKNNEGDCQCLMLDTRTGFFKIYEDNIFNMKLNLGLFRIDEGVRSAAAIER